MRGKITDANSGDPIPYVNVVYGGGGNIGTTTDFDGNYELKTTTPTDTLIASYIGYKIRKKAIVKGTSSTVNFQLEEDVTKLQEIVFNAGENPAYAILRKVVKNKSINDKQRLTAYEYETYSKIEIDVDNMSDKFRGKKLVKKITQVLDSVERIAGEDGKPILPMFISETLSELFYRDNPKLKTEKIINSRIHGVGVEDGSLVTQFIGSSFQEYNFYQNWLNIVSKDFVSPIADGWRLYYEYDLTDSLYVGDSFCYRLDFFPKSSQDLAFSGTIWITKEGYALKQVDATVAKEANLNFIDKIRIQQELEKTTDGAWLPVKNRVLIDIGELSQNMAGVLAKFYTSNKNFVVNKPHDASFYARPIVVDEQASLKQDDATWDNIRHEPLSDTEKNVYRMIDTLQNIPMVKTYTDIIKIAVNGYYDAGKIFLGPYVSLFSLNNVEGLRLQSGFKTSIDFSNKWVFGGQFGYGFKDQRVKYSGFVEQILSRDRWTTIKVSTESGLARVGLETDEFNSSVLLLAAQRFGNFRRGFYFNQSRVDFSREIFKGFNQRIGFKYQTFQPAFPFGYYAPTDDHEFSDSYETAELVVESRYGRDEVFIQNDNERLSLGGQRWPIISLRYTKGLKGVLGSDFDYDKVRLTVVKRIRFGPLGTGYVNATGELIFGTLPYPLLALHLGNQTPLFAGNTYNLMNYGEFASDRYGSLQYQHHFEGFILNRIPLMRKLKWRLVGSANVLYGDLSQKNQDILAATSASGEEIQAIGHLDPNKPYVEFGYGIENIFKFFRVDFVHRLSYLDYADKNGEAVNTRSFGLLFSFQFTL